MKAKAVREQREAEASQSVANPSNTSNTAQTGVKRSYSSMTASDTPASVRDAANRPLDTIKPARDRKSVV